MLLILLHLRDLATPPLGGLATCACLPATNLARVMRDCSVLLLSLLLNPMDTLPLAGFPFLTAGLDPKGVALVYKKLQGVSQYPLVTA